MQQPLNPNRQKEGPGEKRDFFKRLLSLLLPLSFILLATVSILFALNAQENRQSARSWQQLAEERKLESEKIKEDLLASEGDVRLLEKRQRELSREKASVEDEKTLLTRLSQELVDVGKLQQGCSNNLAALAEKIAARNWAWVRKRTEPIFSACDRSNLRFQSVAASLKEDDK